MNWKIVSVIVRVLVAIVVGIALFRVTGISLLAPLALVVYGVILWVLFGLPLVLKAGAKAASLHLGDDSDTRVMPEYSMAQARLKEGRYIDAVAEYQKVIDQFPQDIHAHLQIAEIAAEKLNNFGLAELELQSAVAKASSPDAVALAAHRLADFYQQKLQQPARAAEVMEKLRTRLSETKHALGAQQRIAVLQDLVDREQPPAPPKKIAYRATDEEKLRRRRGY
jgi:tetratricopeptide (TPR) repeat protein